MTKQIMRARTPSPVTDTNAPGSTVGSHKSQSSVFINMAVDMSWRLALAVLIPIIGGFKLDEWLHTTPALTITGFILAMVGMALVLWQTLQVANRLPVPKLTAAEKRAVKRQYDEDDDA